MEPHVVDKPVARPHFWKYLLIIVSLLLLSGVGLVIANRQTRNIVSGIVTDPAENLVTTNGRTNLVFLGMGGKGHDAPDLTDSIIFASLRHSDHSISMVSIPRDVWVDSLEAKINTAYHYGNERREGAGKDLSKSAVSEVLGLPVHYVLALDFEGFVKAIDAVGGIDVEVERSFDDYKYPIPGRENAEPESTRYEHIHFEKGLTHMDGLTALKFARSRHAEGDEGTDFARGERQQKIMRAFANKLFQSKTLLNPDTLKQVYSSIESSVDSNIQDKDYGSFLHFFLSFQQAASPISSLSIEEYFYNPKNKSPYQGQWVLVPKRDWNEIHDYLKKSLE